MLCELRSMCAAAAKSNGHCAGIDMKLSRMYQVQDKPYITGNLRAEALKQDQIRMLAYRDMVRFNNRIVFWSKS